MSESLNVGSKFFNNLITNRPFHFSDFVDGQLLPYLVI